MSTLDAELLRLLRASEVHLPGIDLAEHLRTTLHELRTRIATLRAAGFEIEERPGFGYRLTATPDRLVADDLLARLGPCALVREIVVFAETASTNDLALQRGRERAAGGLVVFAEQQSAGRGRFGRRWASASHRGLWFSLLLRPALPMAFWPRLTTWAAASIAAAIEAQGSGPPAVKWPNDILLGGRKVAGILIESGVDGDDQPFAVAGIGVNVNHEPSDFPPELAATAGALREFTGRPLDRAALAVAMLAELDRRWSKLEHSFAEILAEVTARSSLLGQWIAVRSGQSTITGQAESLDGEGHLLLRTSDGTLHSLSAGEVTIAG